MKKHYRQTLFFLLFTIFHFAAKAQPTESQIKKIDSVLTILHQRAMFNGVVLIAQNGKPLYEKALGIANIANNEALTPHSSFNLASISKQFIAMMVMQLKEKGKLQIQTTNKDFLYQKFVAPFLNKTQKTFQTIPR